MTTLWPKIKTNTCNFLSPWNLTILVYLKLTKNFFDGFPIIDLLHFSSLFSTPILDSALSPPTHSLPTQMLSNYLKRNLPQDKGLTSVLWATWIILEKHLVSIWNIIINLNVFNNWCVKKFQGQAPKRVSKLKQFRLLSRNLWRNWWKMLVFS